MHFYKLLKNTVAWKLVNTMLVFFINLLLIKLLGASASGIFFYDIAICSFIILLLSWSLESGINFYASKNNLIISSIIGAVFLLLVVQGLICWSLFQFIHLSIGNFYGFLFIISNLFVIYFSAFLYAQKKFRLLNIIICSFNFIITVLLFFCFYNDLLSQSKYYYTAIYIAGITGSGLVIFTVLLFSVKKSNKSFTRLAPVFKNIFAYSSVALLSNVISFLVTRIDYFFVEKYCTSISLGNYIQISKFGQLLILVPVVIASLVFPLSASDSRLMTLEKVQQLCRGITFIFIPITLCIILTAYQILPWFFGKEFNQMYFALLIYLPGFFALSIITILAAHLAGKKQLKINLIASILALFIVITGDIWLIPIGGINAAAAVSSIAYIASAIYILLRYKKDYNCTISDFIFFKKCEIICLFKSQNNSISA